MYITIKCGADEIQIKPLHTRVLIRTKNEKCHICVVTSGNIPLLFCLSFYQHVDHRSIRFVLLRHAVGELGEGLHHRRHGWVSDVPYKFKRKIQNAVVEAHYV